MCECLTLHAWRSNGFISTGKVPCAAKLLAVVPGGDGVTAGAATPAHSANMLVLATLMLTTVETAPLAAIQQAPPLSALLTELEVISLTSVRRCVVLQPT